MQGHPLGVPGLTIGLLGGSFDPPHEGHVHITKIAIKIFNLSRLWWLVSPGNPIKETVPSDINKRFLASKKIMKHPLVSITDIEKKLQTKFTFQTLIKIKKLYPGTRFVWIMGADNLVNFHHWENWDWIMKNVPIGVLARPKEQIKAGLSTAATKFKKYRIPKEKSLLLPYLSPPVWTLVTGPMRKISSSKLREINFVNN
ncbi:MAG: nicotinate-nucleotide adenylyltransferase [Paracoccaceae bacterium]